MIKRIANESSRTNASAARVKKTHPQLKDEYDLLMGTWVLKPDDGDHHQNSNNHGKKYKHAEITFQRTRSNKTIETTTSTTTTTHHFYARYEVVNRIGMSTKYEQEASGLFKTKPAKTQPNHNKPQPNKKKNATERDSTAAAASATTQSLPQEISMNAPRLELIGCGDLRKPSRLQRVIVQSSPTTPGLYLVKGINVPGATSTEDVVLFQVSPDGTTLTQYNSFSGEGGLVLHRIQ